MTLEVPPLASCRINLGLKNVVNKAKGLLLGKKFVRGSKEVGGREVVIWARPGGRWLVPGRTGWQENISGCFHKPLGADSGKKLNFLEEQSTELEFIIIWIINENVKACLMKIENINYN